MCFYTYVLNIVWVGIQIKHFFTLIAQLSMLLWLYINNNYIFFKSNKLLGIRTNSAV